MATACAPGRAHPRLKMISMPASDQSSDQTTAEPPAASPATEPSAADCSRRRETTPPTEAIAADASDASELHIASYNIHRGYGADGKRNTDRIAHVIRELGCDTIGLQEVDNRAGAGHDSMQLDYLADVLQMRAVAGLTIVRHDGSYGNALLTRRRVLKVRRHDLTVVRREPRGALDVELAVGQQTVRVIVTHFGLRPHERRKQIDKMLTIVNHTAADGPLVIVGDINEWFPIGRPLRWMHRVMGRFPAPATFPSGLPVFALDRIWVRPQSALRRVSAHRSRLARQASDHLPLRATLEFGPRRQPGHEGC